MNWKQSGFFRFLRKFLRLITKPMKNTWCTEFDGIPSVFVCNHDSAYGPIAMCVHFEQCEQLIPWIEASALSPKKVPAYVRGDFWWPRDRWYTKILDYTVTYVVALLLPLVLHGSACIPVVRDAGVIGVLRSSVDALKNGKHILLFPETPTGYRQYSDEINTGFVALGRLLYRRTGEAVNFFPTYIDWKGKEIRVGAPVLYEPGGDHEELTEKVVKAVEEHFRSKGKAQVEN